MMRIKIIKIIDEAFELEGEKISFDDRLESMDNWDSLSKLTLISLIDEHFEVQISDSEFNSIDKIEDLYRLIKAKLK